MCRAVRAVWVFGQELGQTGAESDGVITLLAALLSALAWMPLFIHPKRHIIGLRRVGYPGHWPQSRGSRGTGGQMKESVIMGERQKETLSPNNYFGGGKGGRSWDQDVFPGKLCPYHVLSPIMRSWGAALTGRVLVLIWWWWLAEARGHRKWQHGSHSPTPEKHALF